MRPSTINLLLLLLIANASCFAQQWPQQHFVRIQNSPDSALCAAARQAVEQLPKDVHGRLLGTLRALKTRINEDLDVAGFTFYAQRTKEFTTTDGRVERTHPVDYYVVDIDNDGAEDMVTLSSGGYGPAGEGDTLYLLSSNLAEVSAPVAKQSFMDIELEIGGPKIKFYGKDLDFSPAYFIYPFAMGEKRYLLMESNRVDIKYLVAELVPGTGLTTHCYF